MSTPKCERQVEIEVRLYGEFRRQESPLTMSVPPGASVAQVCERLGLPPETIGPLFVNGRYSRPTYALSGGERVGIFPRSMSLVYIEFTYEAQEGRLTYVPRFQAGR